MDSTPSFGRPHALVGIVLFLLLCLFCWAGAGVSCSTAFAADQVTFSWRANPQSDAVVGYRLYYGSTSRFAEDGSEKQNFLYSYYIDFVNSQLCTLTDSGPVCDVYTNEEVVCEGLYGDTPNCILYQLDGLYYFAMTAYNVLAESDFTEELSERFSAQNVGVVTTSPLDTSVSSTESVEEVASSPLNSSSSEGIIEAESVATAEASAQREMPTKIMENSGVDENIPLPEIISNLQHIYLLLRK